LEPLDLEDTEDDEWEPLDLEDIKGSKSESFNQELVMKEDAFVQLKTSKIL